MANAIAGVGTTFERWSGSAWQFIAEINAIEGPTMNKENIEVTALDTDGGYDEFITGFMEGGTLTLNMNFTRSGYELMKQDFEIDVARDYRITLPDDEDTTLEFEGLVIEIPLTMEAEDKLTVDVTIQVTGEVALASAGYNIVNAELTTYITGLVTELSDEQLERLDTLISALKTGLSITNLSDAFDIMYILANETEEAALRNLVKRAHDTTAVNSPTFAALEGYTGDAVSSYLNHNYSEVSDGDNVSQNNISLGVYCRSNRAASSTKIAAGTGITSLSRYFSLLLFIPGNNTSAYVHSGSATSRAVSDALGLTVMTRNNATAQKIYRNTTGTESNINSNVPPDLSLYSLARNLNGSPNAYDDVQLSLVFISRGLSDAEVSVIHTAFEAYMDANGKGVVA